MININLTHCPTQEQIDYHKEKAKRIYQDEIAMRIYTFMHSGEETMSITKFCFEDDWIFALIMGMCGEKLYGSKTGVAYGRSDGIVPASIVIINKEVKLNRLKSELGKLSDKLVSMKDTESSKYQKTVEKIEKLKEEITNIENSIKE